MRSRETVGTDNRTGVGWTGLRRQLALAVVLGSLVSWAPAGAQSDADAGRYVSPSFGYTLAWDTDDWVVADEREPTGQSTRDFLRLTTNDADREGLVSGIVFVEGTDQDWSDPDDCVRTLAREIDVRPSRDEPIEDPDTGDAYETSGDDRSAAAYVRVSEDEDGEELRQAAMFECRADPDSDLVVAFTHVSAYVDGYFDLAYPAFEALVDSLVLPGGEPGEGDGTAANADEETDQGDGGKPGPGPGQNDEPVASDDGAPVDGDGPAGSEEPDIAPSDDPDPAPSEEPEPASGDPTEFVADEFGVSLTWDEATWAFEGEERGDGYAAVRLSSELLTTAVVPYVSGDGSVTTCLDNYVAILNERGAGTASVVIRPDGQQDITVSEDGTQLQAYVAYTDKDVPFISLIVCYSLGATDVLAIEFTGPATEIRGPEATEQIEGLLAGLRY